jgi:hypothetical protein
LQDICFCGIVHAYYLRLVFEAFIVQKAAQIYDLNVGLSPPFRVAIDILGNKYHVALAYTQPFAEIYVSTVSLKNDPYARFALVAVSSAEMICAKAVPILSSMMKPVALFVI